MDPTRELFSPAPESPVQKIRTAYNRSFVNWQAYLVEAYRDQSFYLNNQWTPEERRYLQQEQRPEYVYNLCRACVNMVQGYQRKNRLSTIVQAVENSSEETADIFTSLMYNIMRHGKGHYVISDAFKGALVTGIGWIGLEVDYREDPLNGNIKFRFYPWNSIITDSFFSERDLSDCDYLIRRAYMSKQEALSRFKDKTEVIKNMQGNVRDELFTYLPEQRIFQSQNLLAYTEYWEPQWEEVQVVINPMTLQEIEVNKKNIKQLRPLLELEGIKSYKKQKPVMKFTAMLNNVMVAEEDNPYNLDEYPFIPVWAVYEPEYDLFQYKMQSMIRCIRDPQIEFNKRISKITDYLDSRINTGWIVKKSKFDNYKDFYKTGQGRVIFGKDNADLDKDARQISANDLPQGLFELQQVFNQLILRICGVNEELLGASTDDKAGVLAMMRQGAGLISLQDVFDGLRQSIEIACNKVVKLVQNNYTPEKVFMITGKQPTPEFYDKNFGKYRAVCVEAPLTETQQQLWFQQLVTFKEMGAPISWKSILQAVPMQHKKETMDDIMQEMQQQEQMQQMIAQAQIEDKAVVNNLLMQEAQLKIAAAQEKLAKAEQDKAASHRENALAAFDTAKAAKEIESMDLDNINKFVETLSKLEYGVSTASEVQNEVQS